MATKKTDEKAKALEPTKLNREALKKTGYALEMLVHSDLDVDLSYDLYRNKMAAAEELKIEKDLITLLLDKFVEKDEKGNYKTRENGEFVCKDPTKDKELEEQLKIHDAIEVSVNFIKIPISRLPKTIPAGIRTMEDGRTLQTNYNTLRPYLYDVIFVQDNENGVS